MLTSDTCLTMALNPRVCATALTPLLWTSTKTKKASRWVPGRLIYFFRLRKLEKSSRGAGTGIWNHFFNRGGLPDRDQKHFCAGRIFENVIGVSASFDFIEAGTAWVGARSGPCVQQIAQFGNLLLRMV